MAAKPTPKAGQPDVAQIIARMKAGPARGRGRRSSLYRWFRENHARLIEEFQLNAPSWPGLAAALGDSGLTNGDNQKPTAEGARTTWYRVRREMSAALAKRSPAATAEAKVPVAPAPSIAPNDDPETRRQYKLVKPHGWDAPAPPAPVPAKPEPSVSAADEPRVDVDDVLAKFMPTATRRG